MPHISDSQKMVLKDLYQEAHAHQMNGVNIKTQEQSYNGVVVVAVNASLFVILSYFLLFGPSRARPLSVICKSADFETKDVSATDINRR